MPCVRTTRLKKNVIPSSVMRTRSLQRPNRSEGPCGKACRIEGLRNHKLPPPAYSGAEESARSLNGRRDDDLSKMRSSRVLTHFEPWYRRSLNKGERLKGLTEGKRKHYPHSS